VIINHISLFPTINLAGGNPSLCPGASLVNFGTIEQLNCLFRYKLRARRFEDRRKMQSSSLLTGPSDHFNCPSYNFRRLRIVRFLYDDIWLRPWSRKWLTKQTWDDAVCIDVCMLPARRGRGGEEREGGRGAEEGGRCWAFRILPSLWC